MHCLSIRFWIWLAVLYHIKWGCAELALSKLITWATLSSKKLWPFRFYSFDAYFQLIKLTSLCIFTGFTRQKTAKGSEFTFFVQYLWKRKWIYRMKTCAIRVNFRMKLAPHGLHQSCLTEQAWKPLSLNLSQREQLNSQHDQYKASVQKYLKNS